MMHTTLLKLFLLVVLVVVGHAQVDPAKCCRSCCDVNGDLKCQTTSSSCFQGQPYTAGGKCGPGNNNYVCERSSGGGGSGTGSGGGGGASGKATCGNPPVECDECCMNGKCHTREECEKAAKEMVTTAVTWSGVALGLCIAGCILYRIFLCKKRARDPREIVVSESDVDVETK